MTARLFARLGALAGLLVCCPWASAADEVLTKGQEIFEKNQHAVVTVQVVVKASYSRDGKASPPSEAKYDLTGTVVDPSGLIALAHSGCDPAEFYKRVMPSYAAYKIESEVTDIKILLEDNTEVPAEIVLRDKDLDLAFVRPKAPLAHPLTAVDLNKNSSAKVLEQVVTLNRLNQASGRAYSASVERILAVIKKPRPFYLHDGSTVGVTLGSPVFTLDGDILGLIVMRAGTSASNDYRQNAASIILPAAEVLKAAKQAPPVQKGVESPGASSPQN